MDWCNKYSVNQKRTITKMKTKDDLLKAELLEDGTYRITFLTYDSVGYSVERFRKDGHCIKEKIENMIIAEYVDSYPTYSNDYEDSIDYIREMEEMENDVRVINQYDENYFELLEWIKYRKYIGDPNMRLDFGQIERLWKLKKIKKIMDGI
jgi:hypothetical protein